MNLRHRSDTAAAIITDAPEAPDVEFRRRRSRYVTMMLGRVVCLILAAVVMTADVPYAGWWAALCIAGMVGLPWAAVLIANDRAPLCPTERRVVLPDAAKTLPAGQQRLL
ncbi:MAG: DUF3099 domain-containing protein [Mycobacteriales bacterium]